MTHTTVRRKVQRLRLAEGETSRITRLDTLATEEPLQIMVNGEPYTTTMRTPGHDLELALGFLVSEGVITAPDDVAGAAHCSGTSRLTGPDGLPVTGVDPAHTAGRNPAHNAEHNPAHNAEHNPAHNAEHNPAHNAEKTAGHNAVTVDLRAHVPPPDPAKHRHVTSACGICGTETVDAVRARCTYDLRSDTTTASAALIAALPDVMRTAQKVFDRTGGLHAAGLFDAAGTLRCLREDVGRHNAVDKVVGWAFTRGLLPLTGHILQVSGRASFELVQKAWLAGFPIMAAVSAPSSLAADLADDAGLTLVGFSRGDHFTIYTGDERITG